MSKLFDINKLRFVILPGAYPPAEYMSLYEAAYSCWRGVWLATHDELKMGPKLNSEEFTRQTEIGAVFHENQCIGMLLMNWADLGLADFKNDSYFNKWTDQDMEALLKNGQKIIILSYATIDPHWRQSETNISMKELVFYLHCRRFKESTANAMTAFVRRQKGIHRLVYRFGAVPIREDVPYIHDEIRVDVTAFYKNTVTEGTDLNIINLGRKLYEERLEVPRIINSIPTDVRHKDFELPLAPHGTKKVA